MDYLKYLPSVITAILIVPLGFYVRERLKNLATSEDFGEAIRQLKESTTVVEAIKSQLNEKYWVQQQIWETKRAAYEEIISCLYLTQKSISVWVEYYDQWHNSYSLGLPCGAEHDEEYARGLEEHIESLQRDFESEYDSDSAREKRRELMFNTKESFSKLEIVFSVKSMYLHSSISDLEKEFSQLKAKIFNDIGEGEFEGFYDRQVKLLDHYNECREVVSGLVVNVKLLAVEDLRI